MKSLAALFILLLFTTHSHGQLLDRLKEASGGSDTLPRLPNDNIEGTIWEYKATYEGRVREGEEKPGPLEGKFRTEGEAIYDVGRRLETSDANQEGQGTLIDRLRQGPPNDVKLPTTQVKRLGEYRYAKDKVIMEFNDEDSLHGTMVLRKKKRTNNVWHGDYREKEDGRTVRKWKVEVRKLED